MLPSSAAAGRCWISGPEIGDVDLRAAVAERERALDDVFELADVAGPGVGHQPPQRVLRHRHMTRRHLLGAELLEEVLHQQRNVVAPLAQRGQLHRDHVEAIEEILAERALGDHLREIGVGRGDDADVDLDGVRVADALELALLQHAQQLRLQRRAHRPDLVEEERPLVRLLEASLARPDRAGERAADVAEELRLRAAFPESRCS